MVDIQGEGNGAGVLQSLALLTAGGGGLEADGPLRADRSGELL